MCHDICDEKNKLERILDGYKLVDCYSVKPRSDNELFYKYDDYKSVFIYELDKSSSRPERDQNVTRPRRIVLKSRKKSFYEFDTYLDFDFNKKPVLEQLDYLSTYIQSTLSSKFSIELNSNISQWVKEYAANPNQTLNTMHKRLNVKDLVYYVKLFAAGDLLDVFIDALRTQNSEKLGYFIAQLIILMSQDEYLFYRFFQAKPGSLKIHSTCGNFYLVEYAEPLTYQVRDMNVSERKQLALKFLELTHQLDTIYLHNEKTTRQSNRSSINMTVAMQVCDVKLDNFGLNELGELKLIDTDMVNTDAYLFHPRVCIEHTDCNFFDCKSYCDSRTKKCATRRVNNNLQAVCEKIFDNPFLRSDGVISGLLDEASSVSESVKHELQRRLESCKRPGTLKKAGNVTRGADAKLVNIFRMLLNTNSW